MNLAGIIGVTVCVLSAAWIGYVLPSAFLARSERRSLRVGPALSRENRVNLRTFLVTVVVVTASSPAVSVATSWCYDQMGSSWGVSVVGLVGLTVAITVGLTAAAGWLMRVNDSSRFNSYAELQRDMTDSNRRGFVQATDVARFRTAFDDLVVQSEKREAWARPWRDGLTHVARQGPATPGPMLSSQVSFPEVWRYTCRRRPWELIPGLLWVIGSVLSTWGSRDAGSDNWWTVPALACTLGVAGLAVGTVPSWLYAREQLLLRLAHIVVNVRQRDACRDALDELDAASRRHASRAAVMRRRDHLAVSWEALRAALLTPRRGGLKGDGADDS